MGKLTNLSNKAIGAIVGAVATVAAIIIVVFFLEEDAYRQIKVYDIDGTASVTREKDGVLTPYINMLLQNKDVAATEEESWVQFLLDEDKYVLMEPSSKIEIEATGTAVDSKTKIMLTKGAIVNRIESKLSEKSSYEVQTPNSIMAVRGTKYRVEVTYDENGQSFTTLTVYEGTVICRLIDPQGRVLEEIKIVSAGEQVKIRGNSQLSEYLVDRVGFSYSEFEVEVLNFIGHIEKDKTSENEGGEEATEEKALVDKVKEEKALVDKVKEENGEVDPEDAEEEQEAEPVNTDTTGTGNGNGGAADGTQQIEAPANPEEVPIAEVPVEEIKPEEKLEEEKKEETVTQSSSSSSSSDDDDDDDDSSSSEDTTPVTTYTVTFKVGEIIFATKEVEEGQTAIPPTLMPSPNVTWMLENGNGTETVEDVPITGTTTFVCVQ